MPIVVSAILTNMGFAMIRRRLAQSSVVFYDFSELKKCLHYFQVDVMINFNEVKRV